MATSDNEIEERTEAMLATYLASHVTGYTPHTAEKKAAYPPPRVTVRAGLVRELIPMTGIYDVTAEITIETQVDDDPDKTTLRAITGQVRKGLQQSDIASTLSAGSACKVHGVVLSDASTEITDRRIRRRTLEASIKWSPTDG